MGNHDAGRAMNTGAAGYWRGRGTISPPTKDEALAALDEICGGWRGADAEFDDYDMPDQPLGRLLAIAFEWKDEPPDEEDDRFYEEVSAPFRDRYEFR